MKQRIKSVGTNAGVTLLFLGFLVSGAALCKVLDFPVQVSFIVGALAGLLLMAILDNSGEPIRPITEDDDEPR